MESNQILGKSKEKDISKIISKYLRYWYVFLIGILTFVLLAFLYLRYEAVPQYEVTSSLLIKDKDKGEGAKGLESFADLGLIKASRNIEDEIGILTSSGIMEEVLRDLSLDVRYYVEGKVNEVEVYRKDIPVNVEINKSIPVSYGTRLSIYIKGKDSYELIMEDENGRIQKTTHQFGKEINKPYGTFTVVPNVENLSSEIGNTIDVHFENISELAGFYKNQLTVKPVNETGNLITLSLLDALPNRGEDIVAKLTEVYSARSIEYKNQLAHNTIKMIDERLQLLTGELTGVEENVEKYKQRNQYTEINSDAARYQQRASEARQELEDYQNQIEVLNSIESYLSQKGNITLVPTSLSIQDPTLEGLISRFNELQLRKRSLLRTTPADNPLVVEVDQQIADIRGNTLETLGNIKRGLSISLKNVEERASRFQYQIRNIPSAERELVAINREQSTKQEIYLYLLQKREEEALSLAAPVSDVRVVDPAKAGSFPVSPNKTSIYLGALIFGFFIPFSFVYVKSSINDKVQNVDDIQEFTNAPILGEIARNKEKDIIVATENNRSPVAELFRLIRFNLKYITAGKTNKVILITSDMKGEGKTFFTINLGASLAVTGKKVIALSFDLRAPRLLEDMGLPNEVGITDYIINKETSIKEITIKSPTVENLDFIGSGAIPPNAGELMLSERIAELIDELKQHYDYILIDSAPVGKVADAFALAPIVDSSIYVVRRNYTSKSRLGTIQNIYANKRFKFPMIVLNDVNLSKSDQYGYGNN